MSDDEMVVWAAFAVCVATSIVTLLVIREVTSDRE